MRHRGQIILRAIGLDMAIVFGVLTFVLKFIPEAGSIISILLPLPLVLVSPDSSIAMLLLAIILPSVMHLSVGNLIEPRLLGDSLELHPITILLSLIFWGMLWGIPGMLLATPITSAVKILCEHLELTQPVSKLLEGKVSTL